MSLNLRLPSKYLSICFLSCSLTAEPVTTLKIFSDIQETDKSVSIPPFILSICVYVIEPGSFLILFAHKY